MTGQKRVIGILGGMGPEATVALYKRILDRTPAKRDQDHLRVIIDSNPKIPDRTAAIVGKGESPLPMMTEGVRNLERVGADFLIIPCNTAHHWLSELRKAVSIPIIDMVGETAAAVAAHTPLTESRAVSNDRNHQDRSISKGFGKRGNRRSCAHAAGAGRNHGSHSPD